MNRTVLWLLLLCVSSILHADEPPAPPAGYQWYEAENGTGTFLRPDGWHVLEEEDGNKSALYISKEHIGQAGMYHTGMMVLRMTNVAQGRGAPPSQRAAQMQQRFMSHPEYEVLRSYQLPEQGGYRAWGVTYIGRDAPTPVTINVLILAADADDVVYLVVFEAPSEEWEEAWAVGAPMVDMLGLAD